MTNRPTSSALPDYPAPPFPQDATMFFCIGAQKAGTTWLYDYLWHSGEVHFARNKELQYFNVLAGRGKMALRIRVNAMHKLTDKLNPEDTRLRKDIVKRLCNAAELLSIYTGKGNEADRHDPYLDYLLKGRSGQPVVGDITPAYCVLNRLHFADMASIGQAKFIFIMRDPIRRMWSQIRMMVNSEHSSALCVEELRQFCMDRSEKLFENNRLSANERANYIRTMTELEAAVPEDRILYVFYEDLFEGPATRQICDFLDIAHYPPEVEKRVNQGVSVPLPDDFLPIFREAFAPQYEALRTRFGNRIPASWMD